MAIPFSDEDLKPAVLNTLDKLKPLVALDGGGIELIAIKDGVVFVQLQMACVGCSSSGNTIYSIQKQMQMDIHPEIRVINTPRGFEDKLDELLKYDK